MQWHQVSSTKEISTESTQFAVVPETKTLPLEVPSDSASNSASASGLAPNPASDSDSDKTTLSGHIESGVPQGQGQEKEKEQEQEQDLQAHDTQHSEMIVITSDNVEELETEALRIQQSQERARRIILQVDPSEVEALRLSVQHDTFTISEDEESVLDFSFLRPASYGSS
jgi:hypothetical protein